MDPKDELALKYYGLPYRKLCIKRRVIISQQMALKKNLESAKNQ